MIVLWFIFVASVMAAIDLSMLYVELGDGYGE